MAVGEMKGGVFSNPDGSRFPSPRGNRFGRRKWHRSAAGIRREGKTRQEG